MLWEDCFEGLNHLQSLWNKGFTIPEQLLLFCLEWNKNTSAEMKNIFAKPCMFVLSVIWLNTQTSAYIELGAWDLNRFWRFTVLFAIVATQVKQSKGLRLTLFIFFFAPQAVWLSIDWSVHLHYIYCGYSWFSEDDLKNWFRRPPDYSSCTNIRQ